MNRFGFERLEVWQKSIDVTGKIYLVTAAFPREEQFGLTNQLRRSANAIPANIAEGSGRGSIKEFQRFIGIAYETLLETVSHLYVARSQNYLNQADLDQILDELETISKMLSGLKNSLNK